MDYPVLKRYIYGGLVIRFDDDTSGEVIVGDGVWNKGDYSKHWSSPSSPYWEDYIPTVSDGEPLRPSHYKKGEDTFAWAEKRYDKKQLQAIAEFNIHKYLNRDKGQDFDDLGKIVDYANWLRSIMEKDNDTCRS